MKRKTKIVCTIGPVTDSEAGIKTLIQAGMDVARLNFSHSSHEQHAQRIHLIRKLSEEMKNPIAILQDLSGPKIRIGKLRVEKRLLQKGDQFILTTQEKADGEMKISLNQPAILNDVRKNDIILMADGTISIKVIEKSGDEVVCEVQSGDWLTSNKGVNFPSTKLSIPALTEKDKEDLKFGLAHGVDYVALSFVKTADDVKEIKELIHSAGKQTPVIAKIEKGEALENIEAILKEADGIMIARGDLGVETPISRVPVIQKQLIRLARRFGKPVITATQMLKSMVDSPMPTRAEATDVANAILDGTDAVMLSEETAVGKYFEKAVGFMNTIALETEHYAEFDHIHTENESNRVFTIPDAVSHSATMMADDLHAAAIVTPTMSGATAMNVSRFRPSQPVIALTPHEHVVRKLKLVWGVYPYMAENLDQAELMVVQAHSVVMQEKLAVKGDNIIITAGNRFNKNHSTNLIQAIEV